MRKLKGTPNYETGPGAFGPLGDQAKTRHNSRGLVTIKSGAKVDDSVGIGDRVSTSIPLFIPLVAEPSAYNAGEVWRPRRISNITSRQSQISLDRDIRCL